MIKQFKKNDKQINPPHSNRAKDAKHAAAGGLTNFLALAAGMAMTVYYILVARIYGPDVQGLYVIGYAMIEILTRLSPLGTDKGLLRYIAAHRICVETDKEQQSLSTAVWLTIIGGVCLALTAFFFAESLADIQKNPESAAAIRLLAVSIPFGALVVVLISGTMGAKVIRYNLYVRGLAQPLLLIAIALPASLLGADLIPLCMAHLVATVLTAGLAFYALKKVFHHIPFKKVLTGGLSHWKMIRFSVPLGLSDFLNAFINRINILILGLYMSNIDVAHFFAADLIVRLVSNARNTFDPVAFPVISEALRQGDRERLGYNLKLMSRWVTLLAVPVITFIFFFGNELLSLFGESFVVGVSVWMALITGHMFNSVIGGVGWVLTMSGRSKLILLNNTLAAGLNLVLCLVLIPAYGLIGAAIAWSISVSGLQIYQTILVYVLEKVHPISLSLIKAIFAGVFSSLAVFLLEPFLPISPLFRALAGAALILVVFAPSLVIMGLETEEKAVLRGMTKRFSALFQK